MNLKYAQRPFFACFYLNLEVQLSLSVTRPPCGVKLTEGPIPYGNILISLSVALLTVNPRVSSFMLYFCNLFFCY